MLSGCFTTSYVHKNEPVNDFQAALLNTVIFEVSPAYGQTPPKCVAILPLVPDTDGDANDDVTLEQAENVRRALYSHLAPHGKRDIELSRVDAVVDRFPIDRRNTPEAYRRIGKALGCDSLLVGTVTRYGSTFFGIYSRVAVGAEVQLIRAKDGEVLWEGKHMAQSHGGSFPLSPVGAALGVFEAATNMQGEQLIRVANDLARRLAYTIPDNMVTMRADGDPDQPADVRYVSARSLNLRSGPGTGHTVLTTLKQAEPVEVVGQVSKDGWLAVRAADGRDGFVAARYLVRGQATANAMKVN